MRQITLYVFRQLLLATLIVTAVMTGVIWLFVSVRAVESIINRGLSLDLFLTLTALQLPNFIVQIVPVALFIATLFVYNRLNSDREILVLRAAGVSPLLLAKPLIVLGVACAALGYAFTLYATPKSYEMFRDLQWDVRYSFSHMLLREGTFNTLSDSITVYIRERTGQDELRGLLIHDTRDPEKKATIIAERGAVVDTPTGARVLMFDGNRQEINRKTDKLSILYFDRYSFDLSGVNEKPDVRHREARERTMRELASVSREDIGNPNDFGRFVVEFHQRILSPLNALGFALLGFVCLISGEYARRGQSSRIVIAAGLFILIQIVGLGLINGSARNLDLVPLLYVVTALPIAVPLFILWRSPQLRFPSVFRRNTAGAEA